MSNTYASKYTEIGPEVMYEFLFEDPGRRTVEHHMRTHTHTRTHMRAHIHTYFRIYFTLCFKMIGTKIYENIQYFGHSKNIVIRSLFSVWTTSSFSVLIFCSAPVHFLEMCILSFGFRLKISKTIFMAFLYSLNMRYLFLF